MKTKEEMPNPATLNGTLEKNISGMIRAYNRGVFDSDEGEATRLFFNNEVKPICAYENDPILESHGNPSIILCGKWKYHSEKGLFVRADPDGFISLAQNHSSRKTLGWNYLWCGETWRDDTEEKGFLQVSEILPLGGISRIYDLVTKFNNSMNAYLMIVQARK